MKRLTAALLLLVLGTVFPAGAVTIGPFDFPADGFPTAAEFVSGGPPTLSFATTGNINGDLLLAANQDTSTFIFGTPVVFDLTFGSVLNLPGPDLVIFELGTPDALGVRVDDGAAFGAEQAFLLTDTGFDAEGFNLNAIAIDLSAFGILAGETITRIQLDNDSPTFGLGGTTISSSIAAVGALNTSAVPEPASWLMLGSGALAVMVSRLAVALRRRGGHGESAPRRRARRG